MRFLLPTALAIVATLVVNPAEAQQMVCRDGAAISETTRMGGYAVPEAIQHMLVSCRMGDLIRVNPQHVDRTQFHVRDRQRRDGRHAAR